MIELPFTTNWNRKLCCECFTTIRLSRKYNMGDVVMITLKGKERGLTAVIDKQEILLEHITNFLGYIDTGYSGEQTQDILRKMNKKYNINWNTQILYLYVLKYEISDNLPCISQNNFIKEIDGLTK